MDLSVVIVNYNVKFFLEQCLNSVARAIQSLNVEVFVVDNNSVDGSCSMVHEKFPQVKLIENKENLGFSKANNQAIRISQGRYVLLLNPDTVVQEDTFTKVLEFMDTHPDAGGLGVKMIDGRGNFLPESKRGLPTPGVAFFKIFGFSRLFPKSKLFGRYHLGFLDKDEVHQVDVLSGAFMLLRKETLQKSGLLDEDYFMYGEDIDLSYRITLAGYKNYYFPETTIIHYKGESTKKSSINYVIVFYNAMIIFARKHFSQKNARLFELLIHAAVYFRAGLAILSRFFKLIFFPCLDAVLMFLGFYLIHPLWEQYKFQGQGSFPEVYLWIAVPTYILIWLGSLYFTGAYDKPYKIQRIGKGIGIGTVLIIIGYSLLPEDLRFSRAMILIGTAWSLIVLTLYRLGFHFWGKGSFRLGQLEKRKIALIGNIPEIERVKTLLSHTDLKPNYAGNIFPQDQGTSDQFIGNCSQLTEIVRINRIDELIFCAADVEAYRIINYMLRLSDKNVDFKIAQPDSISIVGSNSINTAGDLYRVNFNSIATPFNRRSKRLFDLLATLGFILVSPVFLLIVRNRLGFLSNLFLTLAGFKTWVGYCPDDPRLAELPNIKRGIIHEYLEIVNLPDGETLHRSNIFYAKDYGWMKDISLILSHLRKLGN